MSNYTDSDVTTPALLAALDAEIPANARAEDIDVAMLCGQAWDECADQVNERMDSFGGQVNLLAGAGVQVNTLLTNYGMGVSRSRIFLPQIVTSSPQANRLTPLVRWMVYHALVLFYRDASGRLGQDRYQEKMNEFERARAQHAASLWRKGLPMVLQPLPCPGAIHELNAGSWGDASLSGVSSGSAAGANYDVAITWVDQSKYISATNKHNGESGPSATVSISLPASQAILIDISGLVPPTSTPYGSSTFADGVFQPLNATGWNVYAAGKGLPLRLQNNAPLPLATTTYQFLPAAAGAYLDPGQLPDANYAFENMLQRA